MRFDVCVVGSANLDLVAEAARHPSPGETVLGETFAEFPGGKGLNQAVAAARSDAATAFVGAVGSDTAAEQLRAVLAEASIDVGALGTADEPTGRALIVVAGSGENSIVVVPGANATVAVDDTLPEAVVVLCQLEIPLATVASTLAVGRARGSTTVLNPAPARDLSGEVLGLVDVLTPNEHEVDRLGGVGALRAAGCRTVLVTRGAHGVDVCTDDGVVHVPAFDVDALDTTGAGDAFNGALAARLARGDDLVAAVRWGAAAGALATTVRGAVPAQPTTDAIAALLRTARS